MHRPQTPQPTPVTNRREGFTLVEVLLAAALTSILMLAVYSALDLYWTARRAGRDKMEQAQIARAVLQIMASDIRSVAFRLPEELMVTEGSSDSGSSSDSSTSGSTSGDSDPSDTSSTTDAVEEEIEPELTLYGDSTTLVMRISKPLRGMEYSSFEDGYFPGVRMGDMVEVQYLIADSQSGEFAAAIAAQTSSSSSDAMGGLARSEVDVAVADSGDPNVLLENTRVLAPEIGFLQFAYIDGTEVLDAWDTTLMGRLPSAIEITIGFRSQQKLSVSETLSGMGQAPVKTYRLLVTLPMAQPFVAEEEL